MTAPAEPNDRLERRVRYERVRALAAKHWLGVGMTPEQQAAAAEIRGQYMLTALEYLKAARALYETIGVQPETEKVSAHKVPFILGNRNVQLFLAYSILWEAFSHICTAAAYTAFARSSPDRAPLDDERTRIAQMLRAPLLEDHDLQELKILRNGETPNMAIKRMITRSSRELREIYGITAEYSLTNMSAFLQGVVEITEQQNGTSWEPQAEVESWVVHPLDDEGRIIDPDSPFSAQKYRSVITWECYQIRTNLNFLGTSDGSIDDALLIIRAFCLLEPLVQMLLNESRREMIFAL
jgi:hypothetical protein